MDLKKFIEDQEILLLHEEEYYKKLFEGYSSKVEKIEQMNEANLKRVEKIEIRLIKILGQNQPDESTHVKKLQNIFKGQIDDNL